MKYLHDRKKYVIEIRRTIIWVTSRLSTEEVWSARLLSTTNCVRNVPFSRINIKASIFKSSSEKLTASNRKNKEEKKNNPRRVTSRSVDGVDLVAWIEISISRETARDESNVYRAASVD
mgnify:CR=1 FL=1